MIVICFDCNLQRMTVGQRILKSFVIFDSHVDRQHHCSIIQLNHSITIIQLVTCGVLSQVAGLFERGAKTDKSSTPRGKFGFRRPVDSQAA